MLECMLEWLKALGPLVLGVAVFVAAVWFQKWQVRLAKQKLRHELYDRRMAIYVAFRELLVALPEKGDDDIKALLRKATIARFEAPFLLGDAPNIQAYLEELCKQVTDDVIANINFLDTAREQGMLMNDPQAAREFTERASRLGAAKLDIPDRHLRELPQRFAKLLNLTDFLK
jgi:hypothetical protein